MDDLGKPVDLDTATVTLALRNGVLSYDADGSWSFTTTLPTMWAGEPQRPEASIGNVDDHARIRRQVVIRNLS